MNAEEPVIKEEVVFDVECEKMDTEPVIKEEVVVRNVDWGKSDSEPIIKEEIVVCDVDGGNSDSEPIIKEEVVACDVESEPVIEAEFVACDADWGTNSNINIKTEPSSSHENDVLQHSTEQIMKEELISDVEWEKSDSEPEIQTGPSSTHENVPKLSTGQVVMKKWTNMKHNWIKSNNKKNDSKSGSVAKKIRKYKFYKMLFLKTIVEHRKIDSSINEHDVEVDIKFMKYMDSIAQEGGSRSMNFFRGISDTVDKFSDENMIDFQFHVVSILKSIQQREHYRSIPTRRNQWDRGHLNSTTARSGFRISRRGYDFGHSSGLEPISYRPASLLSVHSENAESVSTNSQASAEEFDFSSAFQ